MINFFYINSTKIRKENCFLIFIFFLLTIAILSKSYFSAHGFLSPDSINYLSLAQNLIDGNGFSYYSPYGTTEKTHFSVWPVGYPVLIYILSKLSGISVFWASKVINIFFIGMVLIVLRNLFNKSAYLYGLILFFYSFITIFTYTWSETAFIFGIVWFSASLFKFANNSKKLLPIAFSLLFSSIFMFLSRYVGMFSIVLIGLFGIYFWFVKKDKFKFFVLILISIIKLLIISGYFYYNLIKTGYISGMQRIPAPETNLELFKSLLSALFRELLIITPDPPNSNFKLFFFFLYFILIFLFLKNRKRIFTSISNKVKGQVSLPFIFGLVGFVYLLFIILMRWRTHFDTLNFRLLAPGSFLIFIAFIKYIEDKTTAKFFNFFKILLISTSLLSFIYNVPLIIRWENSITYNENIKSIKKRYNKIEKNSIIIFGNEHLMYLYSDLIVLIPKFKPLYSKNERMFELFLRINSNNKRNIYLEVPESQIYNDNSFFQFIKKNKYRSNTLVKLK